MSTIRVRAIQRVCYGPDHIIYQPGEEWDAKEELISSLLRLGGQLEKVQDPLLVSVPPLGMFVPDKSISVGTDTPSEK